MLKQAESFFETAVFASRWMQAPLYLGLILGSMMYAVQFFQQLGLMWVHTQQMINHHAPQNPGGSHEAPAQNGHGEAAAQPAGATGHDEDGEPSEDALMLDLLTMVDMTMVFNLVVIVTIGGYATFVSKLNIADHEDRPEWLKHITASTLKIKLTSSLVGISGVHLLKTFLNIDRLEHLDHEKIGWQMAVHGMFLISTVILSAADWILYGRTSHVDH